MKNNEIIVDTPIGTLSFNVNSPELTHDKFQLYSKEIVPDLPKGMSVEKCIAVILQYPPIANINKINFSCSWVNLKEKGSSCSGECLDAWEWENNKTLVIIGTEDEDCLVSRLKIIKPLDEDYPVTMDKNTINICLKDIPPNNPLSLHYVIAWNPLPEKVEPSCWFAVDIPHEKLTKE